MRHAFAFIVLTAALLLSTGCRTPAHSAAPYAAAAVEVENVDELQLSLAVRKIMVLHGYSPKGGSGREFTFDRIANTSDQWIYGSFLGAGGITYRVKINLVGLDIGRYVIAASPKIVRDAGDSKVEEEQRTIRGRKELQRILDNLKLDLDAANAAAK